MEIAFLNEKSSVLTGQARAHPKFSLLIGGKM